MARENARRLGLEGRVAFQLGDLLEPVAAASRGRVDLVVSNPPYVDPAERDSLAPEVRDHEPALALFPPGDALAVYRRLVPAAAAVLRRAARWCSRSRPRSAEAVVELLAAAGFERLEVRPDLAAARARCSAGARSAPLARRVDSPRGRAGAPGQGHAALRRTLLAWYDRNRRDLPVAAHARTPTASGSPR